MMNFVTRFTLLVLILGSLISIASAHDEEFPPVTDCALQLTDAYVWSILWNTGQYDVSLNQMSQFTTEVYTEFQVIDDEHCGDVAYYLTYLMLFNADVTRMEADDALTLYLGIYEHVGDATIADAPCAYELLDTFWSFHDGLGEVRNVDALISLAGEGYSISRKIAGNKACLDEPALELTRITLDYAEFTMRDVSAGTIQTVYDNFAEEFPENN